MNSLKVIFQYKLRITNLNSDALNSISNSEASRATKPVFPEKNQDDRINELFENLVKFLYLLQK